MNRVLFLIAAAAALSFAVSPVHAAYLGNAPWCAVVNIGAGDVECCLLYTSDAADE